MQMSVMCVVMSADDEKVNKEICNRLLEEALYSYCWPGTTFLAGINRFLRPQHLLTSSYRKLSRYLLLLP